MKVNRRQLYRKYRDKKYGIEMSIHNAAIAAGYPLSLLKRENRPNRAPIAVPTIGAGMATDFLTMFDQQAMTDRKKVAMCIEGLSATKVIVVDRQMVEVPDHNARHKWHETMLKMCRQITSDNKTTNNTLILEGDFAKRMRNARERATEIMKAEFVKGPAPMLIPVRDNDILDVTTNV